MLSTKSLPQDSEKYQSLVQWANFHLIDTFHFQFYDLPNVPFSCTRACHSLNGQKDWGVITEESGLICHLQTMCLLPGKRIGIHWAFCPQSTHPVIAPCWPALMHVVTRHLCTAELCIHRQVQLKYLQCFFIPVMSWRRRLQMILPYKGDRSLVWMR